MNKKLKKEVIKHLRGLANGSIKPLDKSVGICAEINRVDRSLTTDMACTHIMRHHPESSGSCTFPIPHPKLSPQHAYHLASNLWDRRTIYSKRRLALCDYIANQLEKMK